MTDRELLELAAKAAEMPLKPDHAYSSPSRVPFGWNPLTDDGDALRLAVKLKIVVDPRGQIKSATSRSTYGYHEAHSDPYAATRRAIVRAAAEVGKGMLTQDEFMRMFPGRFEESGGR